MLLSKSFFVSTLLVALLSVTSAAKAPPAGQITAIESEEKFCLMLPPKPNSGIAEHENNAVAFCTSKDVKGATNAQVLPRGFIKTAHFVQKFQDTEKKEKKWVQVTGKMNGKKYGLSKLDGGGQYDIKAPVGSSCAGYKYYVELVEPDQDIYCIRCCKNKEDCPVGKSTQGCKKVLGGNYA